MDGEDEELAKALGDIKLKTIYYAIYSDSYRSLPDITAEEPKEE